MANEDEAYHRLQEWNHTPGYYDGWKDDNATLPPIVWRPNGEVLPLDPSLKIRNHSPDGFDWGYDGEAPLQLALAILYDHTKNKRRSLEYYEDFKDYYVARWNNTGWGITPAELDNWLEDRKMRGK